ncbi:MAG: hypothetical protein HAW63_04630 [Bdellovibrionaceae bacterium]|nr:hypothetical protein [Pseudobdellovibrionaceae bacterium]
MKSALLYTSVFIYTFLINSITAFAGTTLQWQILDNAKQPIKNAVVIVHNKQKTINKKLISDSKGMVTKEIPSSIYAPWTLVVSAPNFITKTLLGISEKQNHLVIFLTKKTFNENVLKGKALNFSNVRRDGLIDFGLTLFSFNLTELWNITAANFFSPKIVSVPSFSKAKVPSNVSLPEQTERYWISVRLKKENYEFTAPKKKKYIAHTLHGQFPLKAAINEIQGGSSFISLANLFKFKAYASQEKSFTKKKDENIDFDLSKKTINGSLQVTTNTNTSFQEILLFSLLEKQGQYLPFDIKRYTSSGSTLVIPKEGLNKSVLGLLTNKPDEEVEDDRLNTQTPKLLFENLNIENFEMLKYEDLYTVMARINPLKISVKTQSKFLTAKKMSIALQQATSGKVDLKFLPLLKTPKVNKNSIHLNPPKMSADFKPHSSVLQLVEIKEIFMDKNKKHKILTTKVLEEVGVSNWTNTFNTDFVNNFKKDTNKRYALQIIFLATTGQSHTPSHATRSFQELF